jgi:hypothetical protein
MYYIDLNMLVYTPDINNYKTICIARGSNRVTRFLLLHSVVDIQCAFCSIVRPQMDNWFIVVVKNWLDVWMDAFMSIEWIGAPSTSLCKGYNSVSVYQ